MEVKATAKHIRISPRKARLVARLVYGKKIEEALNQLSFVSKKATTPIKKVVESAIANATNNYSLKEDNLFIKEIKIDEGRTIKRWMPRARGRATMVRKRTSHIFVTLGELVDSGEVKAKKQKVEAPIKLGKKEKSEGEAKVKKEDKKESKKPVDEKKTIIDPRSEGKGKNTKIEGKGVKGVGSKFFRRKSG